jgi:hypothetical protein
MKVSNPAEDLSVFLFGKTRRVVLSLLFNNPENSYYLRQIVRETGTGIGPIQRELKQLLDFGVIMRSVQGRKVYFRANIVSPVSSQLQSILKTQENTPGNHQTINLSKQKLARFSRKHHIKKLSLFGSVLRNDFRLDSDIDVLVEFENGKTPGLFTLMAMERDLSALVGRKADIRTPQDISRYFRDEVLSEAKVQYDAAR